MSLSIRTTRHWVQEYDTPTGVTWSSKAIGGCWEATFSLRPDRMPPSIERGEHIQIIEGASPQWDGEVYEVGEDGTVTCIGPWSAAAGVGARTAAGGVTTIPDEALSAALLRGAIDWRIFPVSSIPVVPDEEAPVEPMPLTEVLEAAAASVPSTIIGVNPRRDLYAGPVATSPRWMVPPSARVGVEVVGDYVTHLWGDYLDSTGAWAIIGPIIDAPAAEAWGIREQTADLSALGPLTPAQAHQHLAVMLVNGAARKAVTGGLTLGPGELLTTGGVPAPGWLPRGGDRMRLLGIHDGTRAQHRQLFTDVVLDSVTYERDTRQVRVDFMGSPERVLGDILTAAS